MQTDLRWRSVAAIFTGKHTLGRRYAVLRRAAITNCKPKRYAKSHYFVQQKRQEKRHKSNHNSPKKLPFQCIWTAFKPRNDGSYCCKRRHFTQQDTAFHPAINGKTRYQMASTTLSQTYSATFPRQKRNRQTSWEPPFTLAICHHDDEVTTENTSTSFERTYCVLANFNPQYIYC